MRILVVACLAALTACVQTHRPTLTVGSVLTADSVEIGLGGLSIPLPEGSWHVVAQHIEGNNANTSFMHGVLMKINGKTVEGLIHYSAPLSVGRHGYAESSLCGRRDVLHMHKVSNYGGREQDCWGVYHLYMSPRSESAREINEAWDYVKLNSLTVPSYMVSVRFRKATRMRLLNVTYAFNPDLEGVKPAESSGWRNSEWHMANISAYPEKVTYAEKIKNWALKWNPKVDAGFKARK